MSTRYLLWNINGLFSKEIELRDLIKEYRVDGANIIETHCKNLFNKFKYEAQQKAT